jgi:ATP-binding cassette subfamily G (WHITE) protein 2 (SNQ2)
MLDVIGAGATASSEQDWHHIWNVSTKATELDLELDRTHTEGRNRPPVEAISHSEFVTPWLYQAVQLFQRDAEAHWRNPTYLMAKIALNVFGGLFIGFTFFQSKDTQQGTQNKLFVRASTLLLVFVLIDDGFYSIGYLHCDNPQVRSAYVPHSIC